MRALAVLLMLSLSAFADDAPAPRKLRDVEATEANIRKAVEKALPPLWKGIEGHSEVHTCFTCHNHGTTMVAFGAARSRGYDITERKLKEQIDFITADLERNRKRFEKGQGPGPSPAGGETDNTSYMLLALESVGHKADANTAAVLDYSLNSKKDLDHWPTRGTRAPTEASSFTPTALTVSGLRAFGTKELAERSEKRIAAAKGWLTKASAKDTEDRAFRLIGLKAVGADADALKQAMEELRKSQCDDGGWSQLDTMTSDPYATATALYALHTAGGITADDKSWQKGLRYLLGTQEEDGTWFVKSRSKPIQKYFESGFPHGKDQFISCAATGWATAVLAVATPIKK
jgi:hypothetical protein